MYGRISQLFLINSLTCGLEVCLAAGTIFIPPMLLEAGVEERFMTMVLGKITNRIKYLKCLRFLFVCQTDGWIDGWMDGWMPRWMDEWMLGWMHRWVDGWMLGWMDEWMLGWMHRWVDG